MNALFFAPVIMSLLLIAAHLLRAGNIPAAVTAVLAIAVVFVRRRWAAQLLQVILALATIEWIRALMNLSSQRVQRGEPWAQPGVILGSVVALTVFSLILLFMRRARAWYRVEERVR